MRNKKINKKQFTLIELIIVIVVIGILAAMALPKFIGVQRNAKVAAMERDLDVIEKAVMQYVTATADGSYPFIDTNDDKVINEEDLYFKTDNIPQTLKDSLLKASGDDGSKIYKLDMEKLKPYISKIKYPDTEYLYSEKSDTAIDPVGKADGDNFIHHIIGSGTINDGNSDNILFSNKWTKLKSQYSAKVTGSKKIIQTKDGNFIYVINPISSIKYPIEKRDKNGELIWTLEKENYAGIFEDDNENLIIISYGNEEEMYNIEIYTKDKELIETYTLSEYMNKKQKSMKDVACKTDEFETFIIEVDNYFYFTLDMNKVYKATFEDILNYNESNFEPISLSSETLNINKIKKMGNKLLFLGEDENIGTILEYDLVNKTSKKVVSYANGVKKKYDSEYSDIIVDNSGNYIVCGRLSNYLYRGFVQKYNSNWEMQFEEIIGDSYGILMLEDLILTKDNGFVAIGSGTCSNLGISSRQSLIMKFNNKGEYENIWDSNGLTDSDNENDEDYDKDDAV